MEEKKSLPNLATPVAVVIAGLVIAGAILYGNYQKKDEVQLPDADLVIKSFEAVNSNDHTRGKVGAKLTVLEYSDLECPYCKIFHQTMTEVTATNKDIAWVFRHFPIESLHSKATKEAIAAECAASLGGKEMFWQYIDEIFKITPSNDGLDAAQLPIIATKLGLNTQAFNSCLNTEEPAKIVSDDFDSGAQVGVDGTPFVLVIKGDEAYPIFRYTSPQKIEDREVRELAIEIYKTYEAKINEARNAAN